jgi:hypothetical protein
MKMAGIIIQRRSGGLRSAVKLRIVCLGEETSVLKTWKQQPQRFYVVKEVLKQTRSRREPLRSGVKRVKKGKRCHRAVPERSTSRSPHFLEVTHNPLQSHDSHRPGARYQIAISVSLWSRSEDRVHLTASETLVRLCCCAPFIALGSVPASAQDLVISSDSHRSQPCDSVGKSHLSGASEEAFAEDGPITALNRDSWRWVHRQCSGSYTAA